MCYIRQRTNRLGHCQFKSARKQDSERWMHTLERAVQTRDVNGEVAFLGDGDGGRRKGNEEDVLTHCEVSDCE